MSETDNLDKRELVEKLRNEYFEQQEKKLGTSRLVIIVGLTMLLIGIILVVIGFNSLISGPFDFFGYYIGGIVLIFLSIMMILFSLGSYNLAKRDTLVPYIQQRLYEEELKDTDKLLEAVGVKIPQKECPYCGHNNDETSKICSCCQASI